MTGKGLQAGARTWDTRTLRVILLYVSTLPIKLSVLKHCIIFVCYLQTITNMNIQTRIQTSLFLIVIHPNNDTPHKNLHRCSHDIMNMNIECNYIVINGLLVWDIINVHCVWAWRDVYVTNEASFPQVMWQPHFQQCSKTLVCWKFETRVDITGCRATHS